MRSLLAGAPVVLAVLFLDSVSGSLFGQARTPVPAPTQTPRPGLPVPPRDALPGELEPGSGVIRGRVVRADDGTPLKRAHIRAASPSSRESWTTTTDELGRYELKELPAGRYTLFAQKAGFVSLQFGQRRVLESGTPIELAEGQTLDRADFRLPRGSVIAGRVYDEFGEPVAEAQVSALTYRYVSGRRQLTATGRPMVTDDLGQYRLFGLPPGEYVVSAVVREPMPMASQSDQSTGYAPTYYPGTPRSVEAQTLAVELGSELHGVDFSLLPTRTARITGTVRDSVGRPLANAMIMLMEQTGAMTSSRSAGQARPDGSFSIAGVAPGEYMLRVMPRGPGTDNAEFATQKIAVAGQNIDGVHLITTKGTPVSGRIVFDGGAMPDFPPSAVRVFGQSAEPSFGPPGDGSVADNWTFQLHTSGSRLLRPGTPPGWTLKSVLLRGTDITDTPVEFEGSEEVSGVEIVLTNRLSHVTGTVNDDRGGLSTDYTVVVFADDRERWTFPSRFVRTGRPDQDGLFKVDGLPPAQYLATALDYIPPGAWTDPDYLEQLLPGAVRFTLDEGETETLNLKLALAP